MKHYVRSKENCDKSKLRQRSGRIRKKHEDVIVLDADLAAATQTGVFKKEFPERHIDCGIAECNMVGIGAGLASAGKVPFVSTLLCLQQDVLSSRCAILSHIRS